MRLIIYLLDKFEHISMLKLNKYNTWEGQGIKVKKGLACQFCKYIQPPKDDLEHNKEFIDEFSYILDKLKKNKNEVILSGNLNIDLLKVNDK